MEAEPYRDSAGLLTVGCGHLLTKDELSSGKIACGERTVRWKDGPLSPDDIDTLLARDVAWAEDVVTLAVAVPLTQAQFDVLVCFTFNVGGRRSVAPPSAGCSTRATTGPCLTSSGGGPAPAGRWSPGSSPGASASVSGGVVTSDKNIYYVSFYSIVGLCCSAVGLVDAAQ